VLLKNQIFKNLSRQTAALLKNVKCAIYGNDWPILIKFMHIHLHKLVSRSISATATLINYLPPAFIALSIQNGMRYRYLNGRVNSAIDASISCKNFVDFGPVTPEKMGLICILFLRHGKKLAYLIKFLRI